MSTMTDETYNGYANRETWAFNLHWQNDQGFYNFVLAYAKDYVDGQMQDDPEREVSDSDLGQAVVGYVQDELIPSMRSYGPSEPARMMEREVGSWWRINYAEVGAAVRESLDAEGL